ncbi:hypothetical protein GOODEAATRI_005173 [Goodea atripinnis]|uniref:Uncharacterized protein n=1 Tax=Goodea atripinnis TaxID=208336 RepID=A0ABV0NJ49_9TELE
MLRDESCLRMRRDKNSTTRCDGRSPIPLSDPSFSRLSLNATVLFPPIAHPVPLRPLHAVCECRWTGLFRARTYQIHGENSDKKKHGSSWRGDLCGLCCCCRSRPAALRRDKVTCVQEVCTEDRMAERPPLLSASPLKGNCTGYVFAYDVKLKPAFNLGSTEGA